MLIINADDWGGWKSATDAALACFQQGRITSVTAMVFMADSERAAALANDAGMDMGLHLNLNLPFTATACPENVRHQQKRVCRWLQVHKYAQLLYNPMLRGAFRSVYGWQIEEFQRLYGRMPSHLDGHQHMHLCMNMLVGNIIPKGEKVRRNFSFWPGEKNGLNRAYRNFTDRLLARRYRLTDYFFSLSQCLQHGRMTRVKVLAKNSNVELMLHPEQLHEFLWLTGYDGAAWLQGLQLRSYKQL